MNENTTTDPVTAAYRELNATYEALHEPRTIIRPSTLRSWAANPRLTFDPLAPAAELDTRSVTVQWLLAVVKGDAPSRELVAALATAALEEETQDRLLARLALVAYPVPAATAQQLSDTKMAEWLIHGGNRPEDLDYVINGALIAHFTALHVHPGPHTAELLAIAATAWWAAGQTRRAARAVRSGARFGPTSQTIETLRLVVRHRSRPQWMDR